MLRCLHFVDEPEEGKTGLHFLSEPTRPTLATARFQYQRLSQGKLNAKVSGVKNRAKTVAARMLADQSALPLLPREQMNRNKPKRKTYRCKQQFKRVRAEDLLAWADSWFQIGFPSDEAPETEESTGSRGGIADRGRAVESDSGFINACWLNT